MVGYGAPISGLPEIGIKICAGRASPTCVRLTHPTIPTEQVNDLTYRLRHGGARHLQGADRREHDAQAQRLRRQLVESSLSARVADQRLRLLRRYARPR